MNNEVIRFLAKHIIAGCDFDVITAELKVRREQEKWVTTSNEFVLLKNIAIEIQNGVERK